MLHLRNGPNNWARGGNCVTITDDTTDMFMNRNVFLMSDDTCLLSLLIILLLPFFLWTAGLPHFGWFIVSVSSLLLFSSPDHRHSFFDISFVCRDILWTGSHFSLAWVSAGISDRERGLDLTPACQI
jgi:hypothetical protein